MKIQVKQGGIYKELDLYQDSGATIGFQIQVSKDVTKRFVAATDSFNIPSTGANKAIIDPQITGLKKYVDTIVEFENGYQFKATMYINTSNEYMFGDEFNVKLVSNLAEELNKIGEDGIEALFTSSDDFKYVFTDYASYNVPYDKDAKWFFLSASNRNGVDYDGVDDFPVYTDSFIDPDGDNGQLFVTASIYGFFSKLFSVYGISNNISATDILMDGVTIDDVYLFFPVKLQSTNSRDLSLTVTKIKVTDTQNETITISDSLNQLGLQEHKVTGTTDTNYNLSLTGSVDISFIHKMSDGINLSCDDDVTFISGNVDVYLYVYKDDERIKSIKICRFGDDVDAVALPNSSYVTVALSGTINGIELLATSELTFTIGAVFNDYHYDGGYAGDDGYGGCNRRVDYDKTLNGDFVPNYCETSPDCDEFYDIDISGDGINILLESQKNISPCTIKYGNTSVIEDIDIVKTMEKTGLKLKYIVNDVLVRFNAGFYMDSAGNINFSTFKGRYNVVNPVILTKWENGYSRTYNQDVLGVFDYKNRKDDRNYDTYKDDDGSIRLIGDVDSQNFGGDKDEKISLNSSYVERNLYKKDKHVPTDSELKMLQYKDSNGRIYGREWCGVPTNERIKNNSLKFLVGFLGSNTRTVSKLYIPYVDMVELPSEGSFPTVTYLINSNINNVTDEQFYSSYGTPAQLTYANIESGSVFVRTQDNSTTFIEGSDYSIDYINGTITTLSTGTMNDAEFYKITYRTGDLPAGNKIKLHYPDKENTTLGANLNLGDSTNHEVDNTTKLYNNFIPVLSPYDNYININAVVDISIMNRILDGSIVSLMNDDGTSQDYYPLEISGISLEHEKSIANIKMIKKQ